MKCDDIGKYMIKKMKVKNIITGEATIINNEKIELYYESGKISMIRNVFSDEISLTVIKNFQKGSLYTTKSDKKNLDKILKEAINLSDSSSSDENYQIAEHNECRSFIRGIKEYNLNDMYKYLEDFIIDTNDKYPTIKFESISIEFNKTKTNYVNTFDASLTEIKGYYTFKFMFVGENENESSSFNKYNLHFKNFSIPFIEMKSIINCLDSAEKQIESKSMEGEIEGDIILSPSCVETVLFELLYIYLSDTAIYTKTSPWKNLLGKKVASELLQLTLDPSKFLTGSDITEDKYISRDMAIIEDGILKNFMLTKEGAKRVGMERSDNTSYNAIIESGNRNLNELIETTSKGILINRLSCGDTSANGDFSGVAKNSFLIESGKIKYAIKEIMISGNIGNIFNSIKEISSDSINNGNTKLPYIKIDELFVYGK